LRHRRGIACVERRIVRYASTSGAHAHRLRSRRERARNRAIPCLSDNYGFLLHDPETGLTAAIDTPDAAEILAELDRPGWRLSHILNTHTMPTMPAAISI
jgi:glyoxylase-like metal-dependent hydrolase (beta-lactamase superfamily II)